MVYNSCSQFIRAFLKKIWHSEAMKSLIYLLIATVLSGEEIMQVRKSEERGKAAYEWLSASYTFSFSEYYDPQFMGFHSLRVMNEDRIAPGKGFDTHPHDNMEILTYIIDGALAHKDNMGNQVQIKKGEFQLMSAGTGVEHSEFNPSSQQKAHLLQMWIDPKQKNLKPTYQQKSFQEHLQGLKLVVSPEGDQGSLRIHQEVKIFLGRFLNKETIVFPSSGHPVWIQMIQGSASIGATMLYEGDGASLTEEQAVEIQAGKESEFLLFEFLRNKAPQKKSSH